MADPKMDRVAAEALVSICAHVALSGLRGRDLDPWRAELRDVADCLEAVPEALVPMRVAALSVVEGQDLARTLSRLHYEVKLHYARTAANRVDAFRQLAKGVSA